MKTLHFLRHGQAVHNPRAEATRAAGCSFDDFLRLMKEDDAFDADLTALGREQARGLLHRVRAVGILLAGRPLCALGAALLGLEDMPRSVLKVHVRGSVRYHGHYRGGRLFSLFKECLPFYRPYYAFFNTPWSSAPLRSGLLGPHEVMKFRGICSH